MEKFIAILNIDEIDKTVTTDWAFYCCWKLTLCLHHNFHIFLWPAAVVRFNICYHVPVLLIVKLIHKECSEHSMRVNVVESSTPSMSTTSRTRDQQFASMLTVASTVKLSPLIILFTCLSKISNKVYY